MRLVLLFVAVLLASCQPTVPQSSPVEGPPSQVVAVADVPSEGEDVPPAPEPPAPPVRPLAFDKGTFEDLNAEVALSFPGWLADEASTYVKNESGDVFAVVRGHAVGLVAGEDAPNTARLSGGDADGDGIPDALDIVLGAKKTAINAAAYGSPYREIDYPGGDVPRDEGVCTDTVVRAIRNAGFDLQRALKEDIEERPRAYPMVKQPNPNIDHRRVKTLLPYFEKHWVSLPVALDDARHPYLPGDVLFMNTMGDKRPDHVGIVDDQLGRSGAPLIINNFTDGYSTAAMDIAAFAPLTHRFRVPTTVEVALEDAGLEGVLARNGLALPPETEQVVLVLASSWEDSTGRLTRFERRDGAFVPVGAVDVTLGSAGLGVGRGLHPAGFAEGPQKREGDRRAPAGVFELGTAFGPQGKPYRGSWAWRSVGATDVFVDDPGSKLYNTWQRSDAGDKDWKSAERLDMYELGLVVRHNAEPAQPGAGSAIFLHTWGGESTPTLGCTAMERDDLVDLLAWLNPEKRPVLVQVVGVLLAPPRR